MFTKRTKAAVNGRIARISQPSHSRKSDTIRKSTRDLFSILNVYLWLKGIGYEKGLNLSKEYLTSTVASLLLTLALDGSSVVVLYSYAISLIKINSNKQNFLVLALATLLNCLNRILLCKRRPKLKVALQRLLKVFDKFGEGGQLVTRFNLKLVVFLLVNDIYRCAMDVYFLLVVPSGFFRLGFISQPFLCAIITLRNISSIDTFVAAYFCSVCFLLTTFHSVFNKKLQESEDENLELLFELHREVTSIISGVNSVLYAHILLTTITVLISVFRETYVMVFSTDKLALFPAELRVPFVILVFLHFVVMCLSSSSVIKAASAVEASAKELRVKFFRKRSLRILSSMKDGFDGFKLLDSIVMDESLILSAVGALVTYGILIATFNTSASNNGGQ